MDEKNICLALFPRYIDLLLENRKFSLRLCIAEKYIQWATQFRPVPDNTGLSVFVFLMWLPPNSQICEIWVCTL